MWDFKFSWRRVWCSELSSGLYCRVKWLSTSEMSVDNHFTQQYNPEDSSEQLCTSYWLNQCHWLLLRAGIVQSVPCTVAIFWSIACSHLSSDHFVIHPIELSGKYQQISSSKAGRNRARSGCWVLPVSIYHSSRDLCHSIKSCDIGSVVLLSLWRKSCYGFLLPLKIHHRGWAWTCEPWAQWQGNVLLNFYPR
jgi:hypothetical protein